MFVIVDVGGGHCQPKSHVMPTMVARRERIAIDTSDLVFVVSRIMDHVVNSGCLYLLPRFEGVSYTGGHVPPDSGRWTLYHVSPTDRRDKRVLFRKQELHRAKNQRPGL
jgi:hypothetical protein